MNLPAKAGSINPKQDAGVRRAHPHEDRLQAEALAALGNQVQLPLFIGVA
jgi:hypothetical protein